MTSNETDDHNRKKQRFEVRIQFKCTKNNKNDVGSRKQNAIIAYKNDFTIEKLQKWSIKPVGTTNNEIDDDNRKKQQF